uniref:Uncharacterized protein n=1 Tax=Lepeophtheirus salmonis TaxID=72036 RepID=A0A0K2SVN1_LEPSM
MTLCGDPCRKRSASPFHLFSNLLVKTVDVARRYHSHLLESVNGFLMTDLHPTLSIPELV